VEREHSGLRHIAGYGVTVTRGAASAMMFTYSSLLITMCRNTITILRDTFLHIYIPFDSAVSFHKYIAIWALVFTGKFNSLKTYKYVQQIHILQGTTLKLQEDPWLCIYIPNTSQMRVWLLWNPAPEDQNSQVFSCLLD
jgi:hypothetical protein